MIKKKTKITVTVESEVRKVSNDRGESITVKENAHTGRLTIRTAQGDDYFLFHKSKPEMVRRIAELLIAATENEN